MAAPRSTEDIIAGLAKYAPAAPKGGVAQPASVVFKAAPAAVATHAGAKAYATAAKTGAAKAAVTKPMAVSDLASLVSTAQSGLGVQGGVRNVPTNLQPVLTLEALAPAWAVGSRVGADETRVYVSRPNRELTPVSGTSELRVYPPSDGDKIILWTVANHVSMAQRGRSLHSVRDLWSTSPDAGYVAAATAEVASASNTAEDAAGDDDRFKRATEVFAKSGYTVRGSPAKKWLFDVDAWMRSAAATALPAGVATGEVIEVTDLPEASCSMTVRGIAIVRATAIDRLAAVAGSTAPTYSASNSTLATLGSLPAEVFTKGAILECHAGGHNHIVAATGRLYHHRQAAFAPAAFNAGHSTALTEYVHYSRFPVGCVLAPMCAVFGGTFVTGCTEFRLLVLWGYPTLEQLMTLNDAERNDVAGALGAVRVSFSVGVAATLFLPENRQKLGEALSFSEVLAMCMQMPELKPSLDIDTMT